MFSVPFVCLFVCLSVSKITEKLPTQRSWRLMEGCRIGQEGNGKLSLKGYYRTREKLHGIWPWRNSVLSSFLCGFAYICHGKCSQQWTVFCSYETKILACVKLELLYLFSVTYISRDHNNIILLKVHKWWYWCMNTRTDASRTPTKVPRPCVCACWRPQTMQSHLAHFSSQTWYEPSDMCVNTPKVYSIPNQSFWCHTLLG